MGGRQSQLSYVDPTGKLIQHEINSKNISKKDEISFILVQDQIPFHPGDECYIMSGAWLDNWHEYAKHTEESKSAKVKHPGIIDNEGLVDYKSGKVKTGKAIRKDFRPVHKAVWEYLFRFYGATTVIYFYVPSGLPDNYYEKGGWSKLLDFHSLQLHIIHPSFVPTPSIRRHLHDGRPSTIDEPKIKVAENVRLLTEASIVGYDIRSTNTKGRFYAVYIIEVILSADSNNSNALASHPKILHVQRTYEEFFLLDRTIRKYSSSTGKIKIPPFPRRGFSCFSNDNVKPKFLETRRIALEKYLQALVAQKEAVASEELNVFLDSRIQEFSPERIPAKTIATTMGPIAATSNPQSTEPIPMNAPQPTAPQQSPHLQDGQQSVASSVTGIEMSDELSNSSAVVTDSQDGHSTVPIRYSDDSILTDDVDVEVKSTHSYQPKIRGRHRNSAITLTANQVSVAQRIPSDKTVSSDEQSVFSKKSADSRRSLLK